MHISVDNFIALIVSSFGILLCLGVGMQLLARKEGIKQTNLLLGLLLLTYGLTLINSLMAMTGLYSKYQYLYFLPLAFSWSIGPLFYFFVKSRVKLGFRLQKTALAHFLLPVMQFAFYLSIGFRSTEFKSRVWTSFISPYGQYIEEALTIIMGVGYLYASIRMLNAEIPKEQWNHSICQWLRKFAISLLALLSISIVYEIADWVLWGIWEYNLFNTPWLDFPLKLAYGAISLFIGYNAFVYQNQSLAIPPASPPQATDTGLEEQLEKLIQQKQIYLDPELNLDSLAKMLGANKSALSSFFSSKGENFRLFINKHRVSHFTSLIEQGKHEKLSLLGLAFESGFNSKASFNRVFKQLQGQTPSEYLKSIAKA